MSKVPLYSKYRFIELRILDPPPPPSFPGTTLVLRERLCQRAPLVLHPAGGGRQVH